MGYNVSPCDCDDVALLPWTELDATISLKFYIFAKQMQRCDVLEREGRNHVCLGVQVARETKTVYIGGLFCSSIPFLSEIRIKNRFSVNYHHFSRLSAIFVVQKFMHLHIFLQ